MKRIEAVVYGMVQGVSFRHYARQEARRLNLTGWVKNERDRTVQVVAEGPEAALQQLVAWLRVGSPYGRVDKVDVTWSAATAEFKDFQVLWHG